ncbi:MULTISPECIES: DUF4302 domain-containing protein [Pedobacter]|uniref:DUF4302 domain-containing protein n=1 Tax=Pedobacter TaxID=84567 RepID=UPI001E415CC0|nr:MULTISPECIES: DUF4302 domain-containing protein [Pedobacter]
MKKHLFYIFLFALALGSCKKDEAEPIMGNVDERLSATLADYQKQLTGAEFGWKGYLLTDSEVPATFLFSFTDKNRTTMSADYANTPAESSYRLKALQRPTLLFDSYSTLHLIADPTSSVFGGATAAGYYSDFEFAFLSSSADTIKLEGTFNKSKLILIRSKSAAESAAVFTSVDNIIAVTSKLRTYFKRTTIGGVDCEVKLDGSAQILSFSYLDGATLKTVKSNYYVSGTSINLYAPLTVGTATVTQLSGVSFDASSGFINASVSGTPIQIKEAIAPLKLDVNAAQRWYTQMAANFNGCWVSDRAFHANGVDDFCNFRNIAGYQNLWYAGPAVFGGTNEGLITFTGALGAPYTYSRVPFTVNAGIARFTLASNLGTFTGTTAIAQAMTAARAIMYGGATVGSAQDWYFIPTSDDGKNYDMVRVSDAQAWISWRPR